MFSFSFLSFLKKGKWSKHHGVILITFRCLAFILTHTLANTWMNAHKLTFNTNKVKRYFLLFYTLYSFFIFVVVLIFFLNNWRVSPRILLFCFVLFKSFIFFLFFFVILLLLLMLLLLFLAFGTFLCCNWNCLLLSLWCEICWWKTGYNSFVINTLFSSHKNSNQKRKIVKQKGSIIWK